MYSYYKEYRYKLSNNNIFVLSKKQRHLTTGLKCVILDLRYNSHAIVKDLRNITKCELHLLNYIAVDLKEWGSEYASRGTRMLDHV